MVNRRIIDAVVFMQMTLNCICFFESSSLDQSVEIIQSCMKDIDEWMTINNLKLYKSKTEFIVIGSQPRPKTVLAVGLEDVYSSNAGVIFEETSFSLKSK